MNKTIYKTSKGKYIIGSDNAKYNELEVIMILKNDKNNKTWCWCKHATIQDINKIDEWQEKQNNFIKEEFSSILKQSKTKKTLAKVLKEYSVIN